MDEIINRCDLPRLISLGTPLDEVPVFRLMTYAGNIFF